MGNLYQLIPNAFQIYSDSYARIGEIGFEAVEASNNNSPKQPRLEDQLIHCSALFYELTNALVLNDDGDAIIAVNIDTAVVNSLLLQIREAAGLNTLSTLPTPLTITEFNQAVNGNYSVGGVGALLQSNGVTYLPLEMGSPGEVLTSTPTGLVWSAVVGNGIPSGGTTGQYLEKIDNTSYNVQWSTLTVSKITDLTASAAELNILDGVTGVAAVDINQLTGINSNIQIQLNNRLTNSLQNGKFYVGNVADVATAVTPTGVVTFDNAGVFSITNDSIVDVDINSAAAITRSKIASGSANRVVINSSLGVMTDAAAITASRVLVSDANGIPVASGVTTTTLGYLDVSSSIQASLDERLVVDLTGVAQGDLLTYNGTDWINLGVGTSGQVLTTDGTSVSWGSAAANGLPSGGTANQILRKIDGTNYNTEWHTLVLADVTDVSTTSTEINLLSGLTVDSTVINFLEGANDNIQDQINSKLTASLTYHAIFIGGPGNTAQQVGPGSDGSVLTVVAGHPTWQTPPSPGNVSGPVSSTDNAIVRWNLTAGDSIQDSGVILDDSNNTTYPTGAALRTSTSAGNTLLLQAYDVDGTAYVTWATLTANDTVSFDIHTSTTIGTAYIYRVGGTDVSLADGGTGASLSDPGADRLWGWDDTDGAIAFITIGTNLSYDHATHTLSASGGVSSVTLTGDVTGTGTGTVATTIANAAVTYAKFQDVAGLSVVGRSANSSGVTAAITAGSDGDILRRSGTSIGFGTIGISSITMNTNRILARTTASSGPVQEITAMYGLSLASGELFPAYEIVVETGTALTIDSTYRNKVVYCTSAAQVDITLTDEAEGFGVIFVKQGTGNLVFAVDTGLDPLLAVSDTISIQNTAATFVKQDATTWTGFGSLGTSGGGGLVPENGLSETNPGFIGLGGTALNMDTVIDGNTGTYGFTFTGLSNLILEDITEDNTVTQILALDSGNAVKWIDIADIGGSSFYQTIQNAGIDLTQRAKINVFNGLSAADDAAVTDIIWGGQLTGDTEIGGASGNYSVLFGLNSGGADQLNAFTVRATDSGSDGGIILETNLSQGVYISGTTAGAGKIRLTANQVYVDSPFVLAGYATGSLPTASSHTRGLAYDTTTNTVKVSNGSAWVNIGSGTVTSIDVSGGSTGMTFVGGPVTSSGTITMTGTLEVDNGGTGQTSYTNGQLLIGNTTGNTLTKATLTGTADRVTVTNGAGSITLDIAATYVGQSSITTLGTIATGVWQGTTIAAVHGGTGQTVYAVGDILYASTTTALSKLASVASGSYLRSAGTGTAPVWSTTLLPNSSTTGDLLYASASNVYSNLADVATGNALISGGVSTAPSWGKITSAHIDSSVLAATAAWLVTGTTTITAATTIASNFRLSHTFNGTWTSTTNNDYHVQFSPSITADANNRVVNAVNVAPTMATGGFTNTILNAFRVNGRTLIKGLTTTNTGGTFVVTDSNDATFLDISDDGRLRFFNNGSRSYLAGGSGTAETKNGSGLFWLLQPTAGGMIFSGSFSAATGQSNIFRFINSFSGTATTPHTQIEYTGTYNASSTGTIAFLDYNPTETAIGGAHYFIRQRSTTALSGFGIASPVSTLETGRSFGANTSSTSTDITLDVSHYSVRVDASGANRTITLPAASGCTRRIYVIKKSDSSANTVTMDGNSSETIDGATTKVINTQYAGYMIQSNGTSWDIIATF